MQLYGNIRQPLVNIPRHTDHDPHFSWRRGGSLTHHALGQGPLLLPGPGRRYALPDRDTEKTKNIISPRTTFLVGNNP